jgi:tetratricopeptide (TPR) repeat protein
VARQRGVTLETPGPNRRIALVIGNGAYTTSPLKNPPNDAADMATALSNLGFTVEHGVNLTQRQMKFMIREFGQKLKGGGQGLFYFAGHGVQLKGRNYLIPVDAEIASEADVEDQGVDANLVLGLMDEAGNGVNVIILDACRNNPFARSFRSASNGLAQVDAPTGTLVAYSTAPGRVARDGTGRNGAYTAELLKQMAVPGLPIEELMKRVRASLKQLTDGEQVPWESSSLTGDFYLNKAAGTLPSGSSVASEVRPAPGAPASDAAGLIRRAEDLFRQGEDDEVIRLTTEAIRLDPNNAVAYRLRADSYTYKSEQEQSLSDLRTVLRLLERPVTAREYEARCFARLLLENVKNKTERDYADALADCNEAIRAEPSLPMAYHSRAQIHNNSRAQIHDKLEDYDQEIRDYTTAIKLDPRQSEAYANRGTIFLVKDDFDGAIRDYTEAIRLAPKRSIPYKMRGLAHYYKKEYDQAIRDLTVALGLTPPLVHEVYSWRALAYDAKGDLEQAIRDVTKAIGLDPQNALYYRFRAAVYEKRGDTNSAAADLQMYKSLTKKP